MTAGEERAHRSLTLGPTCTHEGGCDVDRSTCAAIIFGKHGGRCGRESEWFSGRADPQFPLAFCWEHAPPGTPGTPKRERLT